MKYQALNNDLFKQNRARFAAQMKPNSIALLISNPQISKSADALYDFVQNPDFFYLTGVDQEECAVLIFPDAPEKKFKEVLFVRKTNETIAIWEGKKLDKKEATERSGIENVQWMESFHNYIPTLIHHCENIYLNTNEHGRKSTPFPYGDLIFAEEIKQTYPLHNFNRTAPILGKLRAVKSTLEIAAIQHACNITGQAFERVCKFIKPGVKEYEVEAEIIHEFISNAANGHAYHPIIASGKNACVLHYVDNNQTCQDGDLILMDFGSNYGNYASDLTRTIPVNGKFTNRQKAVYNAVLKVMKAATNMLRPGVMLGKYTDEVGKIMEGELLELGLISKEDIEKQDPKSPAFKKYFMHGTSHHLGLDVHDVGSKYMPIEAGMVFTVEPGIYIPDENIGVRIENDVVVTSDGEPKDLMAHIPREVEEIEALMNQSA